jgi:hypothetical protein
MGSVLNSAPRGYGHSVLAELIPIATAAVGATGGFAVARYQANKAAAVAAKAAKAERSAQLRSLALDIAKYEIKQARLDGLRSPEPLAAHYSVIRELLDRYDVALSRDELRAAVGNITSTYCNYCHYFRAFVSRQPPPSVAPEQDYSGTEGNCPNCNAPLQHLRLADDGIPQD